MTVVAEVTTKSHSLYGVYEKTASFSADFASYGPYVTYTKSVQYSGSSVLTQDAGCRRVPAGARLVRARIRRILTRRRGSSCLLSGKTCTAGRSPIQVRTNWTAPTGTCRQQDVYRRSCATRNTSTAVLKRCITMAYGLSRYEEGFFFVFSVGGYNKNTTISQEGQFGPAKFEPAEGFIRDSCPR